CPSSHRCRSREKRSRGRWFPASTFQRTGRWCASSEFRFARRESLQKQSVNPAKRWSERRGRARGPPCRGANRKPRAAEGCDAWKEFRAKEFAWELSGSLRSRRPGWLLFGHLALQRHFAGGIGFAFSAGVGDGQLIVPGRIGRNHF